MKCREVDVLVLIFQFADIVDVCVLIPYAEFIIYLCINATFAFHCVCSGQGFCVAEACSHW